MNRLSVIPITIRASFSKVIGLLREKGENEMSKSHFNEKATPKARVCSVIAGNTETEYVRFGNGEKTFVILPGLSVHSVIGAADAIADAYRDFCEEYTVYVFDRVKSLCDGYTVWDMADDTAAAMQALNIKAADVFGASQGGMIAQCLSVRYPELVHKLILGSTLSEPNDRFREVLEEWIHLAESRDESGLINSFVNEVYSENTLKTYRDVLVSSNANIREDEFCRFLILAKACRNFNCRAELSSVRCPTLVLGAEGDRVTTAEGSRQIADILECKMYLYGMEYGHGVYDEAPDYRRRCLNFLADKDGC